MGMHEDLAGYEPRTDDDNTAAHIAYGYWREAREAAAQYDRWMTTAKNERRRIGSTGAGNINPAGLP